MGSLANLNPFLDSDIDKISNEIVHFIDDKVTGDRDATSLYNVVSRIVQCPPNIDSLHLEHPQSIELKEETVPTGLMPPTNTLREIACELTCKPFNVATNAHQIVKGMLEKLKGYEWNVKAVIVLAAFALDFGETWCFSSKDTTKQNATGLHIFRLTKVEEIMKENSQIKANLVQMTLNLIASIIKLDNIFNDKTSYNPKDFPELRNPPRHMFTYWATFSLFACAHGLKDLNEKNPVKPNTIQTKIHDILDQLSELLNGIQKKKEKANYPQRLDNFVSPKGIWGLLRALICLKDSEEPQICEVTGNDKGKNTAGQVTVSQSDLTQKNILLFISGFSNIEQEIEVLISVQKEKQMENHKILWIPVVDLNDIIPIYKTKFDELKSKMVGWYVLNELTIIGGKKLVESEWHYHGKSIVVVTNPQGHVINKNALYMIKVWRIKAFPFESKKEEELFKESAWLWDAVEKVEKTIVQWTTREDMPYIFLHGGKVAESFASVLTRFKEPNCCPIKVQGFKIESFNFAQAHVDLRKQFWENITNSFMSNLLLKDDLHWYDYDTAFRHVEMLLSMKMENEWAILCKGREIQSICYGSAMTEVLKKEESFWNQKMVNLDKFPEVFMEEYKNQVKKECLQLELTEIGSGIPFSIFCPDPLCKRKMMIRSVTYKCCHGAPDDHHATNNICE